MLGKSRNKHVFHQHQLTMAFVQTSVQWYENIGTYRSNESLKEMLNCQPVTAFTRDRNIKELIRSNKTQKNKVKKEKFRN